MHWDLFLDSFFLKCKMDISGLGSKGLVKLLVLVHFPPLSSISLLEPIYMHRQRPSDLTYTEVKVNVGFLTQLSIANRV